MIKEKYNSRTEQMLNTIETDALYALKAFSGEANKSTGNGHPSDFKRWCDFIFIIFRNNIELSVDELEYWLKEDGWGNEKMVHKLGLEFEYSLYLLEQYEQN